ncbi:MAG TPA: HPF/RaiA family ribosome-associated protein [Gammaproteobacteria bacterium]|nr:HPF/RaiA family ribosome-associated protein [Gammaproteobacteria bacterium]
MSANAEHPRPHKPVFIRAVGAPISQQDRDYIRGRLDRRLQKFDETIERTSVRIEDINGPRGGVDKRCRIKVVLSGLPSVVIEEHHYSPRAAVDEALDRVERSVGRAIGRRRTN